VRSLGFGVVGVLAFFWVFWCAFGGGVGGSGAGCGYVWGVGVFGGDVGVGGGVFCWVVLLLGTGGMVVGWGWVPPSTAMLGKNRGRGGNDG